MIEVKFTTKGLEIGDKILEFPCKSYEGKDGGGFPWEYAKLLGREKGLEFDGVSCGEEWMFYQNADDYDKRELVGTLSVDEVKQYMPNFTKTVSFLPFTYELGLEGESRDQYITDLAKNFNDLGFSGTRAVIHKSDSVWNRSVPEYISSLDIGFTDDYKVLIEF